MFIDELNKCGFTPNNVIIWDKLTHSMGNLKQSFGSRYESIIWVANREFSFPNKRPQDIIASNRISGNKLIHPNEKPVDLLVELIKYTTNENDTVLDCFMGSGSTGIACANTNRNFIGIELDENYFNIAKSRIKNYNNYQILNTNQTLNKGIKLF